MKIGFVSGGSYKSFYINYFHKIHQLDVLIFNFGIIYDYVIKEELLGDALVTKELLYISKQIHGLVLAGVNVVDRDCVYRAIISADGDKIHINTIKKGSQIKIDNSSFLVGDEHTNYLGKNKIILTHDRLKPNIKNCNYKRLYAFCDNYGVSIIRNKELVRKSSKFSVFNIKN